MHAAAAGAPHREDGLGCLRLHIALSPVAFLEFCLEPLLQAHPGDNHEREERQSNLFCGIRVKSSGAFQR